MTLYEYSLLPEHLKVEATWEGKFVSYRQLGSITIVLYKIEDFYVEGYYDFPDNRLLKLQPLPAENMAESRFDFNLN